MSNMNTYCTYLRVSTQRQGAQGLGIAAQRQMCAAFIKQNNGQHAQEFMDVESGTHRERNGLWNAIDYCKANGCSLVIAKLDRLARDVEFTFKVINTGIDIHFTDMPVVNSMILGVFASVAQYEREMISKRTKDALAAKKARGESLGGASSKWQVAFSNKSEDEKSEENARRGGTKNMKYLQSKNVQVFVRTLKKVFPLATKGDDMYLWNWDEINTKGENKFKIYSLLKDFKEIDPTLFRNWDLSEENIKTKKMQVKLAGYIDTLYKSARCASMRKIQKNESN